MSAERVAQRFLETARRRKHYRIDRRRLKHLNDPRKNREQMRDDGGYSKWTIEIIPIKDVAVEKVWKPKRFEDALAKMRADQALDPINASEQGGKWVISDGIHRTNASIEMRYTHIPVFVSTWIETPEAYVPPELEKPELEIGAKVRLRKPWHGGIRDGEVEEKLGPRRFRGVNRFYYGLRFEGGKFGDFGDDEFDPVL